MVRASSESSTSASGVGSGTGVEVGSGTGVAVGSGTGVAVGSGTGVAVGAGTRVGVGSGSLVQATAIKALHAKIIANTTARLALGFAKITVASAQLFIEIPLTSEPRDWDQTQRTNISDCIPYYNC